jgi:hypothetical protein
MDWQQMLALLIVFFTAAAFLWAKLRTRRFALAKDTHCGCAASKAGRIGPGQSIRFQARKGERARIVVKNR